MATQEPPRSGASMVTPALNDTDAGALCTVVRTTPVARCTSSSTVCVIEAGGNATSGGASHTFRTARMPGPTICGVA